MIPYFYDKFNKKTLNDVNNVIKNSYVTKGKVTEKFEKSFLNHLGYKNNNRYDCLGVSSCTSGLYLLLKNLKLKTNDEVIVPSLSFVADANVVVANGAKVFFADINSDSDLNISLRDIEKKINKKTKAIIVMHYGGIPCQIKEIVEICKKKKIFLIEDACHALFTEYDNKKLGTFGDASVFSFYGNKNMSTAEGGMIFSNSKIIKNIEILSSHGITLNNKTRLKKKKIYYDVIKNSLNFRIDDIRSTIGLSELNFLKKKNLLRYKVVTRYLKLIKENDLEKSIKIPFKTKIKKYNSHHIFPILLPKGMDNSFIFRQMLKNNIQLSMHYPPIHLMTFYRNKFKLDLVESLHKRLISLPLYPNLSFKSQSKIIKTLKKILSNYKK